MKPSRYRVPVWGGLIAAILVAAAPPEEAQESESTRSSEPRVVTDLATRFHLMERYGTEVRSKPEAIGQYRVAFRETIKVQADQAQGSPHRSDIGVHAIYTERPAQVTGTGSVLSTVRRYEAYRLSPDPTNRPSASRPLEGMTLWYQPRNPGDPLILTLSGGRGLRETEYIYANRQIFMPDLAGVLPSLPSRIADRWSVSRAGSRVLLGESPGRGEPLIGTLQEVRKAAKAPEMEAVITITGRVAMPQGDTSVNAQLVFTFPQPSSTDPSQAKARDDEGVVSARGAITELRLATARTTPIPGTNGRLRSISSRELVLGRQLGTGAALAVPDPAPTPTEANSWLTYEDPQGKYHFRHPQELQMGKPADGFSVVLARPRAGGEFDTVDLQLQIKTGDAESDRLNRDPEFRLKLLKEEWKEERFDVLRGPAGYLSEPEWATAGLKVYRIEAVLRGGGTAGKKQVRLHRDYYLVLFGRDESLFVMASTVQDPPLAFRKQVEAIIRTFRFGPPAAR